MGRILMRRGSKKDFDPQKLFPGEWAVSIDPETENQIVWMCFSPGVVKRMGTYEDFKTQIEEITEDIRTEYGGTFDEIKEYMEGLKESTEGYIDTASQKAEEAAGSASSAAQSASAASQKSGESEKHALMAKSYAVGTDGTIRPSDITDNAEYYADLAKQLTAEAQKLLDQAQKVVVAATSGGLIPGGTIAFADLPENPNVGYMYNIADDFTTDSRFEDGSGLFYRAGANVYYTKDGKWDVMVGVQVTGVKGNAESFYRIGNVNLTPANIGLGNVNNTSDADKDVATARTITETLPISKGGTGQTTGKGAANTLIGSLDAGSASAALTDDTQFITRDTDNTYCRHPLSKIWDWIRGKLATVATSGKYSDLSGAPSIGNGEVIIKQAGTEKGSFTMNQTGSSTIELTDNNTTYSDATQSAHGLMAAADKKKLDGISSGANDYSLPLAASGTRGGVKTGYSENGKNYPVQLDDEKMYVHVPWTDTNTTYDEATQNEAGLMSAADKKLLAELNGNMVKTQVFTNSVTINGNTSATMTKNVALSGYTPIGFVSHKVATTWMVITSAFLEGNTATLIYRNIGSSNMSNISHEFTVLYVKNP